MTKNYYSLFAKTVLVLLASFCCVFYGSSQTVTVPAANTNTGSVNDPFGTYWGFERSAMIYTSAQIGTTGTINSVGFYLNSVATPGNAVNVRIYMKMRTTLMTANTTYATETAGATLVYGPTTISSASFVAGSWLTIPLTTAFNYTGGTNNLEIIIETNATGTGNEGSTGKQFRYSSPGAITSYQYWNQDNTAPTVVGARSANRPNVRLGFQGNYQSSWVSMNTGSADWCAGETRSVSVNIKNIGSLAWTDGGGNDFNIGVKWNADPDYLIRVDAQNLAPGATATFTFSVTAPLTVGSNNLSFDIVREGCFWFASNSTACASTAGPGNVVYTSPAQNIKPLPTAVNAGSDVAICAGNSTNLVGSATAPTTTITGSGVFTASATDFDLNYFFIGGATFGMPAGAIITSISWTGNIGANCPLWYEIDFWVNGVYTSTHCNGTYTYNGLNGLPANGQTIELRAWDTDFWADLVTLSLNLTVNYTLSTTPTLSYAWTPVLGLSNPAISNPVATPSTTTDYIMTATADGCSVNDTVTVTVVPNSVAPTAITGAGTYCNGQSVVLTQTGGTLSAGADYQWHTGSCAGPVVGTGNSITVSPAATTTYYVQASAGTTCPATLCYNNDITLPTAGTTLANDAESATCIVNQNGYVHFYHSSGRLLASINSYGQDLGSVDVTAYVGAAANVPACNYPSYESAFMGRRYVITPTIQPTSAVDVIMHFDNSEFSSLVTVANSNSTGDDDLTVISDLAISKYSGPNNVDGIAANNCPSAGGNGGTTLHTQASSGNTSSLHAGFSSTARYIGVNISSFSEFWFGGNGGSPLATELFKFSANCSNSKNVIISWSTASETNCARYSILKSNEGSIWTMVNSVGCSENSNSIKNYEVIDNERNLGKTYYRLVETDMNGIESILETLSITCSGNEDLNAIVFPNPSQDDFTLEINSSKSENVEIELMDISGKVITRKNIQITNGTTIVPFNDMNLNSGTYLIRLKGLENQLNPIRVVIQ